MGSGRAATPSGGGKVLGCEPIHRATRGGLAMIRKTRSFKLLSAVLVFVMLGALLVGCGDDDDGRPSKLVFSQVPAEDATGMAQAYTTTIDILIDHVEGLEEIEFVLATEYAGMVEGIIAGRIDAAQYGPFAYVISTQKGANLEVAGTAIRKKGASPGYRSYLVTGIDSGISSLEDLAGKNVCFVDPGSTSGYLFPSEGLLSVGLDPSEGSNDINSIFAGGHDSSILSVASGDCDAGFAADVFLKSQPDDAGPGRLQDTGDIDGILDRVDGSDVNPESAELAIIWKTEYIAGAPFALNLDTIPADMIEEITTVLTEKANVTYALANGYCEGTEEEHNCHIGAGGTGDWGYIDVGGDSYYDGIRRVCEVTGANECEG
ncbi:MAG: phosphate/phosphite/phosphonate ABC transporter substrate-binding protein [Acidimicrobiia bacterium]|nr:phosphate/phosphite/phosphonate ABC transporter substrate-binding protein [Acidimicrobiia bacterium]MYB75227.1 phosphate/phosphite/phosphonate ABC transporter substrate-binding protein [Acidimicrobiia bacterium]MYI00717.1 phosphate/phosphite/phosphonate ABC transporter substrate-binding protein [Acidimicrobiia bacterium]